MSLTDSPDYLFRPEDKAMRMLFPSAEEPIHNSFDEYFDKELYNFSNDDSGKGSPLLDDFFAPEYNRSPSLTKVIDLPREASPQPWREGLWCLGSNQNPELVIEKIRKAGRSTQRFVSPTHLVSNNDFVNKGPTLPFRRATKTVTSHQKTAVNAKDDSAPYAITREQTLSPTPMYAHLPAHGRMGPNAKWQQDFQNIHLQMPDDSVYSSTQRLRKPTEQPIVLRQVNTRNIARNATVAVPRQSPTKYHYPFNHLSRPKRELSSNVSVHESSDNPLGRQSKQQNSLMYLSASVDQNGAPFWTTESLHSSDSSQQSHSSHYSSEYSQVACQNLQTGAWMSPLSTSAIVSPHETQTRLIAPTPQRAAHQVLYHQQERHHGGLGIHYASADEIGRAVSYEPSDTYATGYRPVTPPGTTTEMGTSLPSIPMYPAHIFSNKSPFATPRRGGVSLSRTPSPSISPTRGSPSRKVAQQSPTRSEHSQTRRKSIHKSGPIKDTSHQDTIRTRRRSGSRPPVPRTPKTPKTPTSAGFSQIDFVNFTPKDSAKLMSDVAPSGSSKTRARREQEARDKRKRLSEAALQAVRNAGGDIAALEDAIFV